jgi:hypothetical protein
LVGGKRLNYFRFFLVKASLKNDKHRIVLETV